MLKEPEDPVEETPGGLLGNDGTADLTAIGPPSPPLSPNNNSDKCNGVRSSVVKD